MCQRPVRSRIKKMAPRSISPVDRVGFGKAHVNSLQRLRGLYGSLVIKYIKYEYHNLERYNLMILYMHTVQLIIRKREKKKESEFVVYICSRSTRTVRFPGEIGTFAHPRGPGILSALHYDWTPLYPKISFFFCIPPDLYYFLAPRDLRRLSLKRPFMNS